MNNFIHWRWLLENQFRSLSTLHDDITSSLRSINQFSKLIESENNTPLRIQFIQTMVKEIRGLLDELPPFQRIEQDLLYLASSSYVKFNLSLSEFLKEEIEIILASIRVFYTRTLRMAALVKKKEAKDLARCLSSTISPLQRHLDQLEKEFFPVILEWLQ